MNCWSWTIVNTENDTWILNIDDEEEKKWWARERKREKNLTETLVKTNLIVMIIMQNESKTDRYLPIHIILLLFLQLYSIDKMTYVKARVSEKIKKKCIYKNHYANSGRNEKLWLTTNAEPLSVCHSNLNSMNESSYDDFWQFLDEPRFGFRDSMNSLLLVSLLLRPLSIGFVLFTDHFVIVILLNKQTIFFNRIVYEFIKFYRAMIRFFSSFLRPFASSNSISTYSLENIFLSYASTVCAKDRSNRNRTLTERAREIKYITNCLIYKMTVANRCIKRLP